MKLGELREHARKLGVDGADELHKPELLAKVKDHHYAQAHSGKHRLDTGSGSPGGAAGPSTANEDRGGHATPDTPQANKTASSVASTANRGRPHSPDVHSPDVADEPDRAGTAGDRRGRADDHRGRTPLPARGGERPDLEHAGATGRPSPGPPKPPGPPGQVGQPDARRPPPPATRAGHHRVHERRG